MSLDDMTTKINFQNNQNKCDFSLDIMISKIYNEIKKRYDRERGKTWQQKQKQLRELQK